MVMVYKSKYTPGLKNGKGVHFSKGEKITIRSLFNPEITARATITSELKWRDDAPDDGLGYECEIEGYESSFIPSICIIDWEGKMETREQLNEAMNEAEKQLNAAVELGLLPWKKES